MIVLIMINFPNASISFVSALLNMDAVKPSCGFHMVVLKGKAQPLEEKRLS